MGTEARLQGLQGLGDILSILLGLSDLQAVTQDSGKIEGPLIGGGLIDLGAVSFGVGVKGLGFSRVLEGWMFSQADSGRLAFLHTADEFV